MPNYKKFDDEFARHNCFIKGDISGIQDFIFGIKSENAAKALRARSFFVFALSELAIEMIRQTVPNLTVMYNGGGNFYLLAPSVSDAEMQQFRKAINNELRKRDLHLALSKVDYDPALGFQSAWKALNRASVKDKLFRFDGDFKSGFEKISALQNEDETEQFKQFAENLTKRTKGFEIGAAGRQQIDRRAISLFGYGFELTDTVSGEEKSLENHIIAQMPRYGSLLPEYKAKADEVRENERLQAKRKGASMERYREGETLSFETLAGFAEVRTGTNKLAALKIDLDGLGSKLDNINQASDAAALSNELLTFFNKQITSLWQGTFSYQHPKLDANGKVIVTDIVRKHIETTTSEINFSDNLYIVFAGGDDCLIIGAWDAVFEFAAKFKLAFDEYRDKKLKQYLPKGEEELTFSAGLIVVSSKFPVMRFAALANDALTEAKTADKKKNRISIFSTVLTWEEFFKCRVAASEVRNLIIGKNEPRSILGRIANSARAFGRIQDRLEKSQSLRNAQVWKLYYAVRRSPNREDIERTIIKDYERSLLATITGKSGHINPQVYPLAARWAEFLTKQEKIKRS